MSTFARLLGGRLPQPRLARSRDTLLWDQNRVRLVIIGLALQAVSRRASRSSDRNRFASLATSPAAKRRRGPRGGDPRLGAPKLGRRDDPHNVSLCVEDRHGRDGLIARRQPNELQVVLHGSCLPHSTVRPNDKCNVLTVCRALVSFTVLGRFGRLVGCSVATPRLRLPGQPFSALTPHSGGGERCAPRCLAATRTLRLQ